MASVTALRALLGASLGLGALDLVWLDLALAPRVVASEDVPTASPPPAASDERPDPPAAPAIAAATHAAEPPGVASAITATPVAPPPPVAGDAASAAPAPAVTDARVYFASMSAALDGRARVALRELAGTIGRDAQLVIEGRADHRGDARYNEALSRQRAVAVAAYLRAVGVRAGQIRVAYLGEAAPPPGGELWRDRRVDIHISEGSR